MVVIMWTERAHGHTPDMHAAKQAKVLGRLPSVSVHSSCASIADAHDERTANTACLLLVWIGLEARLLFVVF